MAAETENELLKENLVLRERLEESEETLRALRSGEVDAVVAGGPGGDQIYTLRGADSIYRLMVQQMADGAITVLPDGMILFSNEQFGSAIRVPLSSLVGASIYDFVVREDAPIFETLLSGQHSLAPYVRLKGSGPTPVHVPVRATANRLLFDEEEYICLIITDLTEQERRNHELAVVVSQKTELLSAMQLQAETLRQIVAEKLLLLKEVHHRVKNNLQVICSLLNMQSNHASNSVTLELQEVQRRIMSMALVHETLYGTDELTELDFGDYANSLVADIFETYERPGITYSIVADPVKLNVDQAIPCGLILNELVTNGVKHAYPDGIGGELRVTVSKTLEEVRITVSDDGVGVEDSVLLGERNSLGLTIVMILAKQLGGKFTVVQQPGATFTITFPRKSTLITTAAAINVAPQPPALG